MCRLLLNVSDLLFRHWWRSSSLIRFSISWFEFFFWFQNKILKFIKHEIFFSSNWKILNGLSTSDFRRNFFQIWHRFSSIRFQILTDRMTRWWKEIYVPFCFRCVLISKNIDFFRSFSEFWNPWLTFWSNQKKKLDRSSSPKATKISWTDDFHFLKQWGLLKKSKF